MIRSSFRGARHLWQVQGDASRAALFGLIALSADLAFGVLCPVQQ